jgi:iron complex outermembrane receptor protein
MSMSSGISHCSKLISAVVALTLACATLRALADNQPVPTSANDADDNELSEIVVTGSRIARPESERLQPTTVLTSEYLDKRAYTNVIDALADVPGFGEPDSSLVGAQGAYSAGASFANLFSLGSQRTLTLVDGRRFVPENPPSLFGGTGNGGEQVDLNVIPTQLIDRIETIAVGGAPIYGSDAIAGTVNIILKHDFQGVDFDAQGGVADHGGAGQWRVRGLAGTNFDDKKGNITFSAEFGKSNALLGTERPGFADNLGFAESASGPYYLTRGLEIGGITLAGVPMVADTYLGAAFGPNATSLGIFNSAGQLLTFNNSGKLVPYNPGTYDASGVNQTGGDGINGAQLTTLESPQERINFTSLGHYQVNEHVRIFDELWLSETHTTYPIAQGSYSTALFNNAAMLGDPPGERSGNLILSTSNPFLSASEQAIISQNVAAFNTANGLPPSNQFYLTRLNEDVENGGAFSDQTTKRIVLGVDGSVPIFTREFKYEVSGNYGVTSDVNRSPELNFVNFENALNAVVGPGGQIICAPGYTNSPAPAQSSTCAPFNPFGSGVATPAALGYVTNLAQATSRLTQRDFNASLNGSLFTLPAGDLKAAVGYENRRETAEFNPDVFTAIGAGTSIPTLRTSGSFHTNEVFGEVLVPLIAPKQAIPLVSRLELEAAVREVDHSIAGKATTWTSGLRFEPVSMLQLHGNYTRAIRSPSITEAFNPAQEYFTFANDPCDQTLINTGPDPAVRAANCAKAGIAQPFTSNIVNLSQPGAQSGNPNLTNEIADSRTFGFTVRPIEGMSLTVDYVSIDIENAIVAYSATNVLDACYDSPSYPDKYCSLFTRTSAGQIAFITGIYTNTGYEDMNGVQAEFDWSFAMPGALGFVDLRVNDFYLNKLNESIGFNDLTPYAGALGYAKNKASAEINWHKGPIFALWQTRFVEHTIFDNLLPAGNSTPSGVGNWWVHNLTVGYEVNSHLSAELVVDNVFDRGEPYPLPAVPPNSSNGSALETYFSGVLGRYFLLHVAYKF